MTTIWNKYLRLKQFVHSVAFNKCDVQLSRCSTFHEKGKWILCVTGLNSRVIVYELSGCSIDSRCSYFNVRSCACFEQRAPWHSGNYRMLPYSKTRMWHNKNIQLKTFLPLHTFYEIISFTVLRHLRFYTVEQSQSRYFYSFDQKKVSCLSSYLLPI